MRQLSNELQEFRRLLEEKFPDNYDYEGRVIDIIRNLPNRRFQFFLTGDDTDHLASILRSIVNTWKGKILGGDFVKCICYRNLWGAYQKTDSTNFLFLPVYVQFLYDELPPALIDEIKKEVLNG